MKNRVALSLAALLLAGLAHAEEAPVTIRATEVRPQVHLLQGRGGNMAVVVDGGDALLVDTEYADLGDRVPEAVRAVPGVGDATLQVVNTHWHGDHTGGNALLASRGARIFAHANVRARLTSENRIALFGMVVPPAPRDAWPVATYDAGMRFHVGDVEVRAVHLPKAHTDGDTFLHLPGLDVVHTGDVFFNGIYPFIDLWSGGSVDGYLAAVDRILEVASDDTTLIPGHGPLATRKDLEGYRTMLLETRSSVRAAMKGGRSLEEVVAANPTAAYDEAWGKGFLPRAKFIEILYTDATRAGTR